MKFSYIEIKNFKSYGDYTTRIDLDEKETRLLLGDNGAGKSTFVDAIIWSLYGKSLSPIEEVINRTTKRDCKVEVGFQIGSDSYSCTRFRNHSLNGNKTLVFKNGKDISLRTANDTQKLVEDIIQIQYNAMVSSILYSSESYISFLRARPSDRLKILESILSLKEIQQYHEIVRKMRKPIIESIVEHRHQIDGYAVEVNTINHNIEQYKDKTKNTLLRFKIERDNLEKERSEIEADLENAEGLNVDEELDKNVKHEEVVRFNDNIEKAIEEEESKIKDINELVDELDSVKTELDELEHIDIQEESHKIDKYHFTSINNSSIKTEILKLEAKLNDVDSIKKKARQIELDTSSLEIKNVELDLDKNTCPTCKQPVSSSIVNGLIKENKTKIASMKKEAKELQKEIEEKEKNNKNTLEEIEETRKKVKPEVKPEYDRDFLNEIADKKFALNKKKDEISITIINTEERNKEIKERIRILEEKYEIPLMASSYETEFLKNLKENTESRKSRMVEIGNEIITVNEKAKSAYDKTYIEELKKKIDGTKEREKNTIKEMKEFMNEDSYYDVLQQLFSNQSVGIKKYIIDRMMGVFNERINFYIPFFFDKEISIQFDKDLNEEIKIGKTKVSFNTFSSGEKTRLELAIAFSLFMLVKTFFSTTINLLVFDEILDMNLDSNGVLSVLSIIDNLSRDNSIIVISHRNEYKEYFANQILIRKDDEGFSKLVR